MIRKLFSIFLIVAFPAIAQTVAIRAGNVIDPATGAVAKNQVIVENVILRYTMLRVKRLRWVFQQNPWL